MSIHHWCLQLELDRWSPTCGPMAWQIKVVNVRVWGCCLEGIQLRDGMALPFLGGKEQVSRVEYEPNTRPMIIDSDSDEDADPFPEDDVIHDL